MRPVSTDFVTTISMSHRMAIRAAILRPGEPPTITDVDIVDGSVTLDKQAAVRGRCDITIIDNGELGLVPDAPDSLLAPYGNEIQLWRGIHFSDTNDELVSLGVFRIQEVDVTDGPSGMQLRISGLDRSQRIIDARFEAPYQIAAGTNYIDAILGILTSAWGFIPFEFPESALVTPVLVAQEGTDRWAFAQDMAKAIGMDLYFDGDGICILRPANTSAQAAVVIAEGAGGVLLSANRKWSREGKYNRVIATGENTGTLTPSRGIATDDNPLSATYYYGAFGKVPLFYNSPFITTDTQALDAAQARLQNELGTTEQVNFGSIVLPHLEPGDAVRVTRLRAGIDEDHTIDQLTIPLKADGEMSASTRAVQVTG